jgi:hypothetical protein|tara:strand:+ start:1096 stop:1707 length:612 start_codon:yes stop_codon:yes gene_type:complete
MSSTIGTDTELSAVNSILGSIGQSPLTTLDKTNPEVGYVYNIFREALIDVQNEGWVFNREENVTLTPEDSTKYILWPADALRIDITGNQNDRSTNIVKRAGKLYDKVSKKFEFDQKIYVDIVRVYEFEDIPSVFQRYITYRASTRAATQLVSNPQLVQLLAQQEAIARAACMEYECNQGDHNFMGFPEHTSYTTYQPFQALRR